MSVLPNANDEFQLLEQITDKPPRTFADKLLRYPKATNFHNSSKNRYDDVLPKEETRVCLSKIDQVPESDYINANHVNLNGAYICSQAPLPSTFFDFWRMVWEQEVSIIIMLTELLCPQGKEKAHRYWPAEVGTAIIFGHLSIRLQEEQQDRSIVLRKFRVTLDSGNHQEHRFLTQIQYNGWPDFSAPFSQEEFKKLLSLTEKHKDKSLTSQGTKRPILVHCSAGVGRTGVFVAGRTLFKLAKEGVRLPTFHLVKALRDQRTGMVQTMEQYFFLHNLANSLARSQYQRSNMSQPCYVGEQNFSCVGVMSSAS